MFFSLSATGVNSATVVGKKLEKVVSWDLYVNQVNKRHLKHCREKHTILFTIPRKLWSIGCDGKYSRLTLNIHTNTHSPTVIILFSLKHLQEYGLSHSQIFLQGYETYTSNSEHRAFEITMLF